MKPPHRCYSIFVSKASNINPNTILSGRPYFGTPIKFSLPRIDVWKSRKFQIMHSDRRKYPQKENEIFECPCFDIGIWIQMVA